MPRGSGVSFRLIGPNPLDFRAASGFSPDLQAAVRFSSPSTAVLFQKSLLQDSQVRQVRLEKNKTADVFWTSSWNYFRVFAKTLKGFPQVSAQIQEALTGYARDKSWELAGPGRPFRWKNRTQIMGVLNVTPDSFSDGGRYLDPLLAVERALRLQEEGADWIDVGGESSRPGARRVPAGEEKKRILPVIRACAKALWIPLSVDTYKAEVARAAVGEGARMVNDIGALKLDPAMGRTLARLKVPVILMHMKGKPRTMQKNPLYGDVVVDLLDFFRERVEAAERCGLSPDRLLLDPGFGFGKTPWHNIELTRRLWEFKVMGFPLVMGPSRKSTLGFLLGGAPPGERLEATAAAVTASILRGADFVRVHDVKSAVPVVKIADAIRYDRGLTEP